MLEWKLATEGVWVPMEAGALLASGRDPLKEARSWCERYDRRIHDAESIVVLGVGGGFHIRELQSRFPEKRIVVIEKNAQLVTEVIERYGSFGPTVSIFSVKRPGLLVSELDVQDVLSSIFVMLKYAPSIRLETEYYDQMAKWLLGRCEEGLKAQFNLRPRLREFFESTPGLIGGGAKAPNILDIEKAIQKRGLPLNKVDMTWLALRELVV